MKKALLRITVGLLAVFVLAWGALAMFFPAEKMRVMLQERASAELGSPVSIGSVRVSIWGGLGALVSDINVGSASGLRTSVEAVDIKVRFWPLLQGEYVVDRLIIERPHIRITSRKNNSEKSEKVDAREGGFSPDVTGAKLALGGLSFGKLEIRNGALERVNSNTGEKLSVKGVSFEGTLAELKGENLYRSNGRIEIESISFSENDSSEPLSIPSVSIEYQATVDSSMGQVELEDTYVNLGEGKFLIEGVIPISGSDESSGLLKLSGEAPLVEIGKLMPGSSSTEFGGKFELDVSVKGSLTNMKAIVPEGRLAIVDGAVSSPNLAEQLEAFNVEFRVFPNRIEIARLDMQFSESDLALSGIITNPFPYLLPVSQSVRENSAGPYLQFELSSKRLNIDKLFPEAAPASGVNRALAPPDSTPPIFLPEIKGSGTVSVDTLIYAEMEFSEVKSNVTLERRRIFCNSVKGRVMDGEFEGEMLLDLTHAERPVYSGSYIARSLNVGEFVGRFAPWGGAGLLTGKMSASGSYSASGWRKEDFIGGLTMDMLSNADSLRLTSKSISDALTSSIRRVSGASLVKDQYETIDLRSFKSKLRFVNGLLQVDTLSGFSDALGRWKIHGTVNTEGRLKLSGLLTPTEDIMRALTPKNTVVGALAGLLRTAPEGSITIPFTVTGTSEKPVFSLDSDALSKALNKTLREEGGNILKGLFQRP